MRTRVLHALRSVFKVPPLEKWLARHTQGAQVDQLICKIVPHSHTYPSPSYRVIHRDGLQFRVDISDYLGHAIYFGYDNEESRSYDYLLRLIKPGYQCLDVGTNMGYVCINMAKLAHPGKVFGFEPDRVNFERAATNITLNKQSNLVIYPFGLGDTEKLATMEVRSAHNLGGNRVAKPGTTGTEIEIKTLDSMMPRELRGKIDLIKIDVEGYELKVLRGASQLLKQFHPILFVEINDDLLGYQGDSAKDLIRFLEESGYRHFERAATGEPINSLTDFNGLHFDLIASHEPG